MSEVQPEKAFLEALYKALSEQQQGRLAAFGLGVGILDADRSAIILRVEEILGYVS